MSILMQLIKVMFLKKLVVKASSMSFLDGATLFALRGALRAFAGGRAVRPQLLHPKSWASLRLMLGLMAWSLLGLPIASIADSSGVKLSVSATILKHASLKVLTQPTSVRLTAADIARGYVDVTSPAEVAVQSNTSNGYRLIFDSQGEFVRQTLVKGLGAELQLGASGGAVTYRPPGRGMSRTVHHLEFRFLLSNSAQQGVYAWPLSLSVLPL